MMDFFWSVVYSLAVGLLVWLLYSKTGEYPEPLPRSQTPKREITQAFSLWALACSVSALMALVITPAFDQLAIDRTRRELALAPLLAAIYIALPMGMVIKLNGWTVHDFGLTWKSQSRSVAIFAVALGLMTGGVAFVANQAVIGIDLLPWGALLLLLFTNSFTEEFFHRGVIQSLLERAAGQRRALLVGGILFGLTHVVFDVTMLAANRGIEAILFAVLLQTMAGWLFGIIYMKTRTLWPGIACHYLANWFPSILLGLTS